MKKRIVRIMTGRLGDRLSRGRRVLLASAGVIAVAAPIVFGQAKAAPSGTEPQAATTVPAPSIKFDVVSIRENKSDLGKSSVIAPRDGDSITFQNYPLAYMVMILYEFHRFNLAIGFPEWTKTTRYDITAKVAPEDVTEYHKLNRKQRELMFQQVLADRFHLKAHLEFRETPAYDLVIAKGGPKLKEAPPGETYPNGLTAKYGQPIVFTRPNELEAQGASTADLVPCLCGYVIKCDTFAWRQGAV